MVARLEVERLVPRLPHVVVPGEDQRLGVLQRAEPHVGERLDPGPLLLGQAEVEQLHLELVGQVQGVVQELEPREDVPVRRHEDAAVVVETVLRGPGERRRQLFADEKIVHTNTLRSLYPYLSAMPISSTLILPSGMSMSVTVLPLLSALFESATS